LEIDAEDGTEERSSSWYWMKVCRNLKLRRKEQERLRHREKMPPLSLGGLSCCWIHEEDMRKISALLRCCLARKGVVQIRLIVN
jgi:hypothetical protein